MNKKVKIIGAGLAGCEAAWLLANNNVKVELYEAKTLKRNEVQKSDDLCELVCSNTFRSQSLLNAAGILKSEMRKLGSLILKVADQTSIASDDALAVDRTSFSKKVTELITNHPNITLISENVSSIDDENDVTLIATGPLTTVELQQEIQRLIGKQKLFFMDASAPIVRKDSINFNKVYYAARHNQGKYICCPFNEQEFNDFVDQLVSGEQVQLKDFEKAIFFKGCQPIEQLAKTSKKLLLKGPMSANKLLDANNHQPYAVVQLRQDDAKDSLYNLVGFQTNLKWPEQKRVFSLIPGLENLKIVRYGVMHKNYYINSPKILNFKLQTKRKKNVFFAGQITGVEGYIESASSGIWAAINILCFLNHKKLQPLSNKTVLGALTNYITNPKISSLKPMKCNLGILEQVNKNSQEQFYSFNNSTQALNQYLAELDQIIKINFSG
ncbi:methylenetetrahydrofolate--tRNA-(uracil(54)-C(5))-methyltransferase (FADH(2)-oxidizing) TrmFO [Mycoplasma putrefaciens]|uniref:Methylenetetrahydrofolate--tRNA-(uracil-5-)-methyltransferase TrmFO n=1 Tax=Mycoplasma putrefaciens Mput9231 TaxID=1292033 RepID=M9WA80_9MOLU|nr:methylenetetrahydrofolate--tRNA-(uracil(54)-C(5))-methyltransferase (FADH(2)-oxidizing) TrmFO [Mycoplasma putrefaciens]AGJ90898.1 Methylenetetrahydrofolate-tRNA-(uracil-5-)-methyltransferase [Mycoplasma putrefaciens Mput9231]